MGEKYYFFLLILGIVFILILYNFLIIVILFNKFYILDYLYIFGFILKFKIGCFFFGILVSELSVKFDIIFSLVVFGF